MQPFELSGCLCESCLGYKVLSPVELSDFLAQTAS